MRKNFFDNGRALASVLGFFYHVGLVFASPWIINVNVEDFNKYLLLLTNIINMFRMPLFMLISGYFAVYAVKKYDFKNFSKNKLLRLGLPLLSTMYIFVLLQNIYSMVLFEKKYTIHEAVQATIPWNENFNLSHLWFLYLVLIYSFLLYATMAVLKKYQNSKMLLEMKERLQQLNSVSLDTIYIFFSFVLVSICWEIEVISPFNPQLIPFIDFGTFLPYFLLGVLLYTFWDKYKDLVLNFTLKRAVTISFIMVAATALMILTSHTPHITGHAVNLFFSFIVKYYALLLVLCILYRYLNNTNKVLRYLSDSSYSVYLLHQPIIVIVSYYYLKFIHTSTIFSYIGILVLSIAMTYLLDFLIIRKTNTGKFLFTGAKIPKKHVPLQETNPLPFQPKINESNIT